MTLYADSRIYGWEEISRLLHVVDRYLSASTSIIILGGAAAAFHQAESTTTDVDTFNALSVPLVEALQRARDDTGLAIVVSCSSVAQVPYNFEDRLESVLPELRWLEVKVLEKHDLALSKIVRGIEHDLVQLEEIHARGRFDFETFVDRFRSEMGHIVGDPTRIRTNFLEMIERLFGELKRVAAERQLGL